MTKSVTLSDDTKISIEAIRKFAESLTNSTLRCMSVWESDIQVILPTECSYTRIHETYSNELGIIFTNEKHQDITDDLVVTIFKSDLTKDNFFLLGGIKRGTLVIDGESEFTEQQIEKLCDINSLTEVVHLEGKTKVSIDAIIKFAEEVINAPLKRIRVSESDVMVVVPETCPYTEVTEKFTEKQGLTFLNETGEDIQKDLVIAIFSSDLVDSDNYLVEGIRNGTLVISGVQTLTEEHITKIYEIDQELKAQTN